MTAKVLKQLVDKTGIPFVTTQLGKGVVDERSPRFLGNAALSMVLGMTLLLYALRYGDAGMVAILSSVSPVVVLPLLWLVYKRSPAWGAWLGAALTVAGTVLILRS